MKKPNTVLAAKSQLFLRGRWVRRLLVVVAVLCLFPALIVTFLFSRYQNALVNTVGKVNFIAPLPIPTLATSTVTSDGTRVFELGLQAGTMQFFSDGKTETWGVNGAYLGPTIRAKRGETVRMNVTNNLPEASSVHWHGMHLPAEMDGGPHQPVMPRQTWQPTWTIKQPAATLWYHPHPHGETEDHVYRGVAGMFIVEDDNPVLNQLPHTYGTDDIPVIVQDKTFTADRQFKLNSRDTSIGTLGNEILVNGARTPYFEATTERVRLRLLNASTARIYNFGFSDNREMQLVGSDGGLMSAPVSVDRVVLSPGERAEVIISLRAGERTTLRSFPYDLKSGFLNQREYGGDDSLDIMQIRAKESLAPSLELPALLSTSHEQPQETKAVKTRQFVLEGSDTINRKNMEISRIDFAVTKDTTEIWEVSNRAGMPHNFHVHDVQFKILDIDGKQPPAVLAGMKDTIHILEGQKMRLVMHFADYASTKHPYMYHCHLLEHEDNGMMGQFLVVEPGQVPPATLDMAGHHHE